MSVLLLLAGCVIGDAKYPKPADLPDSTIVDRTRVLAVRAEPPEVAPGGTVTFEALLPDPDGTVESVLWLACPPEQASGYGCMLDFSALDADATPEELAEAGVIGFEPLVAPSYVADEALLDGLEDFDRREGVYVTVQLLALPPGVLDGTAEIDFNEVESAYKRVVVSEDPEPNRNPDVAGFLVDGALVPPGAVLEVDAGQRYAIEVLLTDDALQAYTYVDRRGEAEARVEEPYVTWYASAGEVEEWVSLHPYLYNHWDAPPESGATGSLWAVVRDRRGGMAWWEQPYRVR